MDLRNLPFGISGKHSKIPETYDSELSPDTSTAVTAILRQSSFITDFISVAFEPKVRELEDTDSSGKVEDRVDEKLFSDCYTEVTTTGGAETVAVTGEAV